MIIRFGHDWDQTCMQMDEVRFALLRAWSRPCDLLSQGSFHYTRPQAPMVRRRSWHPVPTGSRTSLVRTCMQCCTPLRCTLLVSQQYVFVQNLALSELRCGACHDAVVAFDSVLVMVREAPKGRSQGC